MIASGQIHRITKLDDCYVCAFDGVMYSTRDGSIDPLSVRYDDFELYIPFDHIVGLDLRDVRDDELLGFAWSVLFESDDVCEIDGVTILAQADSNLYVTGYAREDALE